MTPQDLQTYLHLQQLIIESMQRIANALEQMIPAPKAPNYQFALKDFADFDWGRIGAIAVGYDECGLTALSWKNNTYLRRSPSNKFGAAIWFSRFCGKDERGEHIYEKLCTFKPIKDLTVEPLPQKVASQLSR